MSFIKTIISLIVALLLDFVLWYLWLPPINLSSPSMWLFIIVGLIPIAIALFISGYDTDIIWPINIIGCTIVLFIAVLLLGMLFSSSVFNAKKHASLLEVNNTSFEKEFANVDWNTVPHIDDASAKILGARKMGSLVNEVSQYNVSSEYTLINQNGRPYRVAPLKYAGFFKYLNNNSTGIPGYIIVDCVDKTAEFVRMDEGINYSPSAYFKKDLTRHLRINYPSILFDKISFEIDDNQKPWFVISTFKYSSGIGCAKTPNGCILCDPVTGETTLYSLDEIPEWVDHAVDDNTVVSVINWWGQYQDGFWNTVFGQKNVRQTTEGNNFITIDNDVYLYTGITSVALDESNIGFILVNQRTAEAKYFEMPSAEEYSAMDSAKGQVQHLGYTSTFPILINMNGEPTYFLSLKDDAGLVKMYAMVSVSDIQKLVVTDSSLGIEHLVNEYSKTFESSIKVEVPQEKITFIIEKVYTCILNGNTQYYFEDKNGNVYMTDISKSIKLPTYIAGCELTVTYSSTNINGWYNINSIE